MKVGKNNNGEQVMYGTCRFCGQILNVTLMCEEDATDAEMNRQATLHCGCEGGKEYAAMEEAKARAVSVIEENVTDEEIKVALQTLVSPVCEKAVKSVTIDTGSGTKYALRMNKGYAEVKITRTNIETKS